MTDKELLLYIYGYLNGILNMNKIPSEKLKKINEIILLQQERNKAKLETTKTDDEFEEEYRRDFFREENNSNDNDKYYNENLDLDQQDPDFYS
jgi:hypothetical protein